MADEMVKTGSDTATEAGVARIYEAGYHISPSVKEEELEGIIAGIRSVIEKAGGSFIAEGAPTLTKLAYSITALEAGKKQEYDRGYFGWLKFESTLEAADELGTALTKNPVILRSLVFRTVREETRAKLKAPQLREVKRTDSAKAAPRREETSAPVSEVDLDKALEGLTTE